jgi:primosomal protein N' (replication factor Y)
VREKVDKEDPAIMVGTQMLAKGHDFPGVTLVGVVDADSLLFSPDFRGEERLLQLLTQVAGRAGRGLRPGRVLIQTRHPEHPLIAELLTKDYQEQANELLEERYQRGLPPAGALALLRCDSRDQRTGLQFLEQVAERVGGDLRGCRLVGPLPAPMARRAGLVRCQLIVSGPDRRQVGNAMQLIVAAAEQQKSPPQLRWFVDIDPIDSI